MTDVSDAITVKDMRVLLRAFRKLRIIAMASSPAKDRRLWDQAKAEARKELIERLQRRTLSFTLGPSQRKAKTGETQARCQTRIEKAIEGIAERKYPELDASYEKKLEKRKQKALRQVQRIDHSATPISSGLLMFDEVKGTLLAADWRKLQQKFSIQEIMRFNRQGLLDRTIAAIEAVVRRLRRTWWRRFIAETFNLIPDLISRIAEAYFRANL